MTNNDPIFRHRVGLFARAAATTGGASLAHDKASAALRWPRLGLELAHRVGAPLSAVTGAGHPQTSRPFLLAGERSFAVWATYSRSSHAPPFTSVPRRLLLPALGDVAPARRPDPSGAGRALGRRGERRGRRLGLARS